MKKTLTGVVFAAGLALGAAGSALVPPPAVYVHGLDVARLPAKDGSSQYATGTAYGGQFVEGVFRSQGSRRVDLTKDEQACIDGVMNRAAGLFLEK